MVSVAKQRSPAVSSVWNVNKPWEQRRFCTKCLFPPKEKIKPECVCVRKVNFLTKRLLLNNLCLKSLLVISAGFSTLSCPYMHSLSARWILMQVFHWAVRPLSPAGYQIAARLQCKVLTDGCSLSLSFSVEGSRKGVLKDTVRALSNSVSSLSSQPISPFSFLYQKLVFPLLPSSSIQLLLSDLTYLMHSCHSFLHLVFFFISFLWMAWGFLLCDWTFWALLMELFLRNIVLVALRLQV